MVDTVTFHIWWFEDGGEFAKLERHKRSLRRGPDSVDKRISFTGEVAAWRTRQAAQSYGNRIGGGADFAVLQCRRDCGVCGHEAEIAAEYEKMEKRKQQIQSLALAQAMRGQTPDWAAIAAAADAAEPAAVC